MAQLLCNDVLKRIPSDFDNEENSDDSESEDNLVEYNNRQVSFLIFLCGAVKMLFSVENKTEDGDLDVGKVKSVMLNLTLPPESIPQWGAMLSGKIL